jgi:3-hydroxyisobutyrate dehydrogenase
MASRKVAFIGLGNMGLPMASNASKAGFDLVCFDVAEAARIKAADAGLALAPGVAAAIDDADIVVTMLPAGEHVRAVYEGDDGIIANAGDNTLLIDCSTIDVETARKVNDAASACGLMMLDAPVSGGAAGAEAGTLTFMVGGEASAFERAKGLLETMGRNIFHAGPNGNGQAAKICNNMILGISMIAVSEAFELADNLGLEAQTLFDIASTSSGQCWSLTSYCPVPGPVPASPANRDYRPGFTANMMLKDLRLAQSAAESTETRTPLGAQAFQLYTRFAQEGNGELDFSAIITMLSKRHRRE